MPLRTEIFNALFGAWRLLLLDRDGMNWFNLTIAGFWRSFLAAVMVAPLYFATLDMGAEGTSGPDGLLPVRTLQYIAGWIIFPVIMIGITRMMDWTDRYVAFIVAYNWSSVIMIGIMLPVTLFDQAYRTPGPRLDLVDAFYYIVFMFTLFYGWFVAHTALRIGPVIAIAIVLLDLIVAFAIGIGGQKMLTDGSTGVVTG